MYAFAISTKKKDGPKWWLGETFWIKSLSIERVPRRQFCQNWLLGSDFLSHTNPLCKGAQFWYLQWYHSFGKETLCTILIYFGPVVFLQHTISIEIVESMGRILIHGSVLWSPCSVNENSLMELQGLYCGASWIRIYWLIYWFIFESVWVKATWHNDCHKNNSITVCTSRKFAKTHTELAIVIWLIFLWYFVTPDLLIWDLYQCMHASKCSCNVPCSFQPDCSTCMLHTYIPWDIKECTGISRVLFTCALGFKTSFARKTKTFGNHLSEMTYAHILAQTSLGSISWDEITLYRCLSGQLSRFFIFRVVPGFWSYQKFALKGNVWIPEAISLSMNNVIRFPQS